MCSSGLTDVTAPMALAAGARGVGIGSMINKLSSPQQMFLAVQQIAAAMGRDTSAKSIATQGLNAMPSSVISAKANTLQA